jgi:tRNA nucleotidyltransferase (CCA-adding enzyme)
MNARMSSLNLLRRLPRARLSLLRELGVLADEQGMSLYLVGGVVRDLLLKRVNWDLDLTVEGNGIAFALLVADRYDAGLAVFERFATAKLSLPNGIKLDIASTRRESYVQPAALPDVVPASLREDLYRRDFTINAMAIQLNSATFGQMHDPYAGQCDLKAKTIRVLHEGSFVDDPTRIFRAIRFAHRFEFRLEPETARLLREAAATDLVQKLSGPRLCNEILRLFGEHDPGKLIRNLANLRLLRFLDPRLRYTKKVQRLVDALPPALKWWAARCSSLPIDRPLVYLMALLGGAEQVAVEALVRRLMLSSEQAKKVLVSGKRLEKIVRKAARKDGLRPSQLYHLLITVPDEALVLSLAMAGNQRATLGRLRRRMVEFVTRLRITKLKLRGDDLLRIGLKTGPEVGALLTRLLDAKLDGMIKTKENERCFVRAFLLQAGVN